MAKVLEAIDERLKQFIEAQKVFFVATAPGDGHVNLSPKGLDAFRVLGPHEVAYLDLTGSGAETAAHLKENGRITFMWMAMDGQPLILRLYGQGRVVQPGDAGWSDLAGLFPDLFGARAIVAATIDRVQTSCGFGVPVYRFERERPVLQEWARKKGVDGLAAYRDEKNARSIDGLPTGLAPEPVG